MTSRTGSYGMAAVVLVLLAGCARSKPVAAPPATEPPVSEIQRANDASVARVLLTVAGREREPAGVVFRNVSYLKDVPVSTFLSIMNGGYAKALGVRCSHCHVANFASDEKRPKRAAREMQVMHRSINQALRGMEHIQTPATENRAISCITCHRGTVNPR
jgi:hypothetical protein